MFKKILILFVLFTFFSLFAKKENITKVDINQPKKEKKQKVYSKTNKKLKKSSIIDESDKFTGYGAFFSTITPLTGNLANLLGFRGVFIAKKHFGFGLMFNWLTNQPANQGAKSKLKGFIYGYTGFVFETIWNIYDFIAISGGGIIGAGSFKIKKTTEVTQELEDKLLIFKPEANIIFHIYKWAYFSLGIGYRFTAKKSYKYIKTSDLNGFSGNFMFRIGSY
jgi:hypothetical protein